MKDLFLPLFCSLLCWPLIAQPVLTENIRPSIGDQWQATFIEVDNFDLGSSGANQTWDYSNLELSNALDINFSILDPTTTPGQEKFPDAEFVIHLVEFGNYEFYTSNADSITLLGGNNVGFDGAIDFQLVYTDPEDGLQFPTTFGSNYSYFSRYEQFLFGNFLGEYERNGTVEVDAYGTIITPSGTYDNVLRVIITETSQGASSTQYAWMDANNFIPIFLYETSTDPETPASLYFTKSQTTSTRQTSIDQSNWSAWWDQNTEQIQVQLQDAMTSQEDQIQLLNLQGQLLARQTINSGLADEVLSIDVPQSITCQSLIVRFWGQQGQSTKQVLVCR